MVGIDIIEIERIEAARRRHPRILERLFTPKELALAKMCRDSVSFCAGRFAAKEAVAKALRASFSWHEVEVLADADGAPTVTLRGRAREALSGLGRTAVIVSISHSREHAAAVALVEKE